MELDLMQLSIFDIQVKDIKKKDTEKLKLFTNQEEKITENINLDKIFEGYRSKYNISRIIKYYSGSYGIEVILFEGFKTI